MIVSCESCKSRYKLDDSKITGRGAKITCPKCKHVFVVLAPPPAVAESPKPTMLPQTGPGNEWEDDEPTRVGREAVPAAAAAAPPPPPPAPPPPPSAPEHEVVRPRAAAAAPAAPSAQEVAARAATLDFRKVGVTAWKVKVRIGLVYDFSDIKTLRKYIQDGRVTPADVISHDGKAWKPIGEIPDLDAFFVESYEALEKDFAGKAPPERAQPTPADLGNVAAALAAAAAAELDESAAPSRGPRTEPTGPVYTDPFEAMKQRQRDRGPTKKGGGRPEPKSRTLEIGAAVLLVAALGAVGWWTFGREKPAPAPTPTTKVVTKAAAPAPTVPLTPVEPRDVPTVTPEPRAPAVPEADDNCIKYINGKCVTGAVGPRDGGGGAGSGGRPEATSGGGNAAPVNPIKDAGATDDMQVGDEAMSRRDYNTAVTAYGNAVASGKPGANVKLGEAQWRAGDQAGGGSTLMSAAASNPRAWKVLGQLKEEAGDKAGAKDAYTSYLKSNPKDAAIKARVEALGG